MFRIVVFFLYLCCFCTNVHASESFTFGPSDSSIEGSIKYTVAGRYRASFEKFNGTITFDPQEKIITSVTLIIDVASIKSAFATLDKIVCSSMLLDAKQFPKIIFKSTLIKRVPNGFKVKGTLFMHGITREVEFPFTADESSVLDGKNVIRAHGKWPVARKDFGVIWNPVLDRGGVVVANHITVDWRVVGKEAL